MSRYIEVRPEIRRAKPVIYINTLFPLHIQTSILKVRHSKVLLLTAYSLSCDKLKIASFHKQGSSLNMLTVAKRDFNMHAADALPMVKSPTLFGRYRPILEDWVTSFSYYTYVSPYVIM